MTFVILKTRYEYCCVKKAWIDKKDDFLSHNIESLTQTLNWILFKK